MNGTKPMQFSKVANHIISEMEKELMKASCGKVNLEIPEGKIGDPPESIGGIVEAMKQDIKDSNKEALKGFEEVTKLGIGEIFLDENLGNLNERIDIINKGSILIDKIKEKMFGEIKDEK